VDGAENRYHGSGAGEKLGVKADLQHQDVGDVERLRPVGHDEDGPLDCGACDAMSTRAWIEEG